MKGTISSCVVLLSLGLILVTTMPRSNAFTTSPNLRDDFFDTSIVNGLANLLQARVESPPVSTTTPSSTPSTSTSSIPSSVPPLTTPSIPPPPLPCPLTTAQCNFPACSAIPGCQQCQTASSGNGIICIRCCTGFALRAGGGFCDACSQVDKCRTCNSADNDDSSVICQSCCPGFGLNLQLGPGFTPTPARCDACSVINACTSCIDANTVSFDNGTPAPNTADDVTCTGCAAGFTLDVVNNECD